MSTEKGAAYTFGNNPPFEIERVGLAAGGLMPARIKLGRPLIEADAYRQALEDINDTWSTITDPKTDKTFEVAMANLAAPLDNGIDAELSTFTSSISGNPGNAVEFAENAALHPERQRIYIASFGNGSSSYWDAREQKHIKQTGRFTQDSGEALPTIAALSRALKTADFMITRFSTNSAGGAHATALMASLPEGQVTHAYLKSRPNISDHPLGLVWGLGILANDILDDIKYDKISNDPWKLAKDMVKIAEEQLPNIYSDAAQNRHRTLRQKAGSSHSIGKMLTDQTAFSRGGELRNHPAANDTAKALQQQPEALLTFHFPLNDRLYKGKEDLVQFLFKVYSLGKTVVADYQVEALMMPGKHRDHTKYPGLRWAAESYAFIRS